MSQASTTENPSAIHRSDPVILACQSLSHSIVSSEYTLSILNGIEMQLKRGESLAISGASGSGKSTLLGLLAGLDVATAGEIFMFGQSLSGLDEEGRAALRRRRVGFVFQSFQLLPTLTALDNVLLPLQLTGVGNAKDKSIDALKSIGLGKRLTHYPAQLSGGEQQRVALARAFAGEPELLFADEPTGNLDHANGRHIAELLFEMNAQRGTALLLVTHDLNMADHCQRHLQLRDGRLHNSIQRAA